MGNSASRTQWPEQYLHHVTLDVAPLTLDGLLDSRRASWGEKPERGDLFLKAQLEGEALSGHSHLIDNPVLAQFLCEAFKRASEVWPNVSGKTFFCPAAHGSPSEGPVSRRHAALHFVMTSPGGPGCRGARTQGPLSSLLMTEGHPLNYLMEKDECSLNLLGEFLVVPRRPAAPRPVYPWRAGL